MNRRINMQEASSSSRRSGLPHSMITSFTFGSSKPLVAQPEDPREGGRKLRPRSPVKVETAGKQTLKVEIEVEASSKRVKRGPKDEQKNLAEEVLPSLSDHLQDGIEVMICGINPGLTSSRKNQHFAHGSNHFWKCLALSGLTPSRLSPSSDWTLPDQQPPYLRIGLTNLCGRPSRDASMLRPDEFQLGVPILIRKILRYAPTCKLVCFVGKGIGQEFDKVISARSKGKQKEKREPFDSREVEIPLDTPLASEHNGLGLQPYALASPSSHQGLVLFFTTVSTSGRVTSHQLPQKAELFRQMRLLAEKLAIAPEQRQPNQWKKVSVRMIPLLPEELEPEPEQSNPAAESEVESQRDPAKIKTEVA